MSIPPPCRFVDETEAAQLVAELVAMGFTAEEAKSQIEDSVQGCFDAAQETEEEKRELEFGMQVEMAAAQNDCGWANSFGAGGVEFDPYL